MKHKVSLLLCILSIFIMYSCGNDDEPLNQIDEQNNNPAKKIIGKDGAPMVLIPAGDFQMGSNKSIPKAGLGKPEHTVYLDAFYMDVYEVTNGQYKKFVQATGHREPEGNLLNDNIGYEWGKLWLDKNYNGDNQPVVCVSWDDAKAYADWAEKRLPTEEEWEKAARGGLIGKEYPWGDNITHDDANYAGTGGKDIWSYTSPVGSFALNGYGLYDMTGNVWEWCADWYDDNYYANSPKSNPKGPSSGEYKVLRGGSWSFDYSEAILRVAARLSQYPMGYYDTLGFRCVQDIPK